MALSIFPWSTLAGQPIDVFNRGRLRRDSTYIDDIAEGVVRVNGRPARANTDRDGHAPDPGTSLAPWRIDNIGHDTPIDVDSQDWAA